jgi:putative ABC transport system permease protein
MNIGPILRAMKHNRTRVTLLILEIALTLAIVTNCVNVIIAERSKMQVASGFDDENILWVHAKPFTADFRENSFVNNMIDADLRRIGAIPGVKAAANSHFRLWEGGGSSTAIKQVSTSMAPVPTQIYWSSVGTFETLGVKITQGRSFIEGDHTRGPEDGTPSVAVISQTVADALFPNGDALGKSVVEAHVDGAPLGEPVTIVGVFDRFFNPFGYNPDTWRGVADRAIFIPARVGGYSYGFRYLVRTEPGEMPRVMGEIEKQLIAGHSGRVIEFMPTAEKKARWFAAARLTVFVMTGLIVVLVFVTALGILGITALSVSERTRQIGTRRALGATRGEILRHFLMENWLTTTAGLTLGVAGAYALNFLLVSGLTDVKMPWQLVVAGMSVLWIAGLVATLPPALRATKVPPSIATRSV